MNLVELTGRLTKDPEVRYNDKQEAIARFTLAVDRGTKDRAADFINVVTFKKTAELVEKYVQKGKLIGVEGSIRTGSYEKEGKKYYTTDVFANRIEFLSSATESKADQPKVEKEEQQGMIPEGFAALGDDDIPF